MSEWIKKLKFLNTNFSYNNFIGLLAEIDSIIVEKNCTFSPEFLEYFFSIMNLENDAYMKDGQYIPLGQVLVNEKLKSCQKLTPTLIMYWYLKLKCDVGIKDWANEIEFVHLDSEGRMAIKTDNNIGVDRLEINWLAFDSIKDNYEFNYRVLEDESHEVTHLWLNTRTEETDDLFERLAYYYNQMSLIVMNKFMGGNNGGNPLIHDALLSEFMAYEQSRVYMIFLARKNPNYFKADIVKEKEISYSRGKITSSPPEENFKWLLSFIENIFA